ncbi:signal peptidase I [Ktedonospora formicarum]|uniref:Signal peptidase I n=1 Tax=Ktedonospora formicarum TaxID=2778364 RepID=A0A8J3HZJ6_9CHLR|nr:signal peptidase I [Ktedonospora formicarum]GHO42814.1 signal peptidase I [Ktedonospora formicarum]
MGKRPKSHLAREIVEIAVLTLLIFLLIRFVTQSYSVSDRNMEPSLHQSEYVLVNKIAYTFNKAPERGDVIVFHYPQDTHTDYIERIIGLPGDTVRIDNKNVWVNDKLLNESAYVTMSANPFAKSWKVPSGQYFVLGDNRPQSNDSRYWGFVPRDYIVGKAAFIYWPLGKIRGL